MNTPDPKPPAAATRPGAEASPGPGPGAARASDSGRADPSPPTAPGPFVARETCEALQQEHRRTAEHLFLEIRSLRRLVVSAVLGGQLLAGGLNIAGFAYWLDRHAAQPHPATLRALGEVRTETREDLRDLRREVRGLWTAVLGRASAGRGPPPAGDPAAPTEAPATSAPPSGSTDTAEGSGPRAEATPKPPHRAAPRRPAEPTKGTLPCPTR